MNDSTLKDLGIIGVREQRTYVLSPSVAAAIAACEARGISPYAKTTSIVAGRHTARGLAPQAGDRVLFLGFGFGVMPDWETATMNLKPTDLTWLT